MLDVFDVGIEGPPDVGVAAARLESQKGWSQKKYGCAGYVLSALARKAAYLPLGSPYSAATAATFGYNSLAVSLPGGTVIVKSSAALIVPP